MIKLISSEKAKNETISGDQIQTDEIWVRWNQDEDTGEVFAYVSYKNLRRETDENLKLGFKLTGPDAAADDLEDHIKQTAYNTDKTKDDDSPRDILDVAATRKSDEGVRIVAGDTA